MDGLNKVVNEALSIVYETDLFKEDLELEKLSLEWIELLLPAWGKNYPKIDDNLAAATMTALRWSWGDKASFLVDTDKGELVLLHPLGFEEKKPILF